MVKKLKKSAKLTAKKTVKNRIVAGKTFSKNKDMTKKGEKTNGFSMSNLKADIEAELHGHHKQIAEQRAPIQETLERAKQRQKKASNEFIWTGIKGLDQLFKEGIPKGSNVIIAGGAGSGKTILTSQIMSYQASQGKKCVYMSFEESEERLRVHMEEFGWNPRELEKKGMLLIKRFSTFDIVRSVDALLMKAKGELLIDLDPVIIPKNFKPDFVVVDSLTAIDSAFTGKEDSYRIYIEQLFRFFEKIGATSFLITETEQVPKIFSQTGVEEFLADGVIVI